MNETLKDFLLNNNANESIMQEYNDMNEDQWFLRALEYAGVDNWEGYEEAQDIYEGFDK